MVTESIHVSVLNQSELTSHTATTTPPAKNCHKINSCSLISIRIAVEIHKEHRTSSTDFTEKAHCPCKQEGHTWIFHPSLHWNDSSSWLSRGHPAAVQALTHLPLDCRQGVPTAWFSASCERGSEQKSYSKPRRAAGWAGRCPEGHRAQSPQEWPGGGRRPGSRWLYSAHSVTGDGGAARPPGTSLHVLSALQAATSWPKLTKTTKTKQNH